ncbi:MAG: hypothetical protein ACLFP8_03285 [Alphaproteobacteria bacterium]
MGNYGRLALLALLVLVFSFSTARSYVSYNALDDSVFDSVSRETYYSFSKIIYMTDVLDSVDEVKISAYNVKSSSDAGIACPSLLNSQNAHSQKAPAIRTQRPVGKVAALGMLLGARFALAPPEQHNRDRVDDSDILPGCQVITALDGEKPARSAKAILKYRDCVKAQALNQVVASAR